MITMYCYVKNKLVYKIELQMSKEQLIKQIKRDKLTYYNRNRNCVEIINLNSFDKINIFNSGFMFYDYFE